MEGPKAWSKENPGRGRGNPPSLIYATVLTSSIFDYDAAFSY
jgi:hypothetical protein